MAEKQHLYRPVIEWTGNTGRGTADYRAYERDYVISTPGKPDILGSSDPAFRGDKERWNPEDLFVASISACHKLWYLHLCSVAGVIVLDYRDEPVGTMQETGSGTGRFTSVVLHPVVRVSPQSDQDKAMSLHHEAHRMCFIANSVACPITSQAKIVT
jgi:organic hydroperoxide reductase OsmC/OhrA